MLLLQTQGQRSISALPRSSWQKQGKQADWIVVPNCSVTKSWSRVHKLPQHHTLLNPRMEGRQDPPHRVSGPSLQLTVASRHNSRKTLNRKAHSPSQKLPNPTTTPLECQGTPFCVLIAGYSPKKVAPSPFQCLPDNNGKKFTKKPKKPQQSPKFPPRP